MPIPTELFATIMERLDAKSASDAAAEGTRLWQTLFEKFSPLIGPLGAQLLFMRSLATHEAVFPWLPRIAPTSVQTAFPEFERSLEGRSAEEIVAVNRALASTYTTILSELIGVRLAARFLGAAFVDDDTDKTFRRFMS